MPLELLLQQEAKGLTDEALREVIRYVRFIKIEAGILAKYSNSSLTSTGKRKIRSAGKYRGQGWMSDDFDAPLDDFKEYM
jgi:hypothetical protein